MARLVEISPDIHSIFDREFGASLFLAHIYCVWVVTKLNRHLNYYLVKIKKIILQLTKVCLPFRSYICQVFFFL